MKLFRADFAGKYLGGHAIVVAENATQALNLILTDFTRRKIEYLEKLEIEEFVYTKPSIVYFDDGNY